MIQYTAFGEIRLTQGLTPTKYRYTGQLAQAELGLDFYVSRMYDPLTAHFTTADKLIPEPGMSQGYDRFAYVRNNPIRFMDPIGQKWKCVGANQDHCYDDGNFSYPGSTGGLSGMAKNKTDNFSDQYSWQKVFYNLEQIGIAQNELLAMAYVVATEYGPRNLDDPYRKLPALKTAMENRFGEFCSIFSWSEECVTSFWGYMEGIIKPSQNAIDNYNDVALNYSNNAISISNDVLSSKTNCGYGILCAWATIEKYKNDGGLSQLYQCLSSNDGCWQQNKGVKQHMFGNTAHVYWDRDVAAFIVLSIDEQEKICINSKWNLPSSCSLLSIP